MQFEFKNKVEAFDEDRSGFANRICKLIYNQSGNDIEKAIKEYENIFSDIDEHVENIYELIGEYIPLIAYYELKKYGADNYDFDDEEYEQALINAKTACDNYYI